MNARFRELKHNVSQTFVLFVLTLRLLQFQVERTLSSWNLVGLLDATILGIRDYILVTRIR